MSALFTEAPPSTLSSRILRPESASIAPIRSAVWNAMLSSAARARCAAVVPRVTPTIAPLAAGSQWGAPSPANAGTIVTPPLSGTRAARASTSEEREMSPRPSRSHWTTAPPTKTLPSRAYSVRPAIRHAMVERSRWREMTGRLPVFMSMKHPVP